MKKIILILILISLSGIAYATLTVGNIPVTKTGGSTPVLQNGSISDTGTASGAGNVGVSSTNPGSSLDVQGSVRITNLTAGDTFTVNDQGSDATPFKIDTNGNVGVGSVNPGALLDVLGTVRVLSPGTVLSRKLFRISTVTQSATPAVNSDTTDVAEITGIAQAITSMTSSLTGTPNDKDMLEIELTDNGTARAITWGAKFASTTVALPTTTVLSVTLKIFLQWSSSASVWQCVGVA